MSTDFLVRKPCANNTFGIEIEGYALTGRVSSLMYTYKNFFYFTYDGSLRNGRLSEQDGMEMVSQPMPPKALKRAIDKLFKITLDGAGWEVNSNAGIHVHVSRKYLSNKKANTIAKFLMGLDPSICESVFGRRPNDYCTQRITDSKYVQVNMQHKDTIEFRVFASGNAEWAKYCVDCVEYLIKNAYHLNVAALCAFRDQYKL